ncbi:uncharacterized protein LOC125681836 isoform X2 [Ostrea edulis]|uniref:uncharacterized protein LOC125681836 isoform X2 n=1 Tax=Ostrea edulis TaxID=37623 RepID=UPI0024AECF22|nr:uncharacterized protein LOC125681836 isoform X2 [Ostrea edulis]
MNIRTLTCVNIFILVIALIDARRGGGGGRWFRFSGRSRSASRHVSKFSGNRISSKSQLKDAILMGSVYGATRWKIRHGYRLQGDSKLIEMPEVCYNDKYDKNSNGGVSYLGRFICPTDESMGDDHTYCCGDEGQQYCCTFWDDGGRVAGVVIGILLGVGAIFLICYCCVKRSKKFRGTVIRKDHNMAEDYPGQSVPLRPIYNEGGLSYPVNPPPFQHQDGKKSYMPSDGSLPYPVNSTIGSRKPYISTPWQHALPISEQHSFL